MSIFVMLSVLESTRSTSVGTSTPLLVTFFFADEVEVVGVVVVLVDAAENGTLFLKSKLKNWLVCSDQISEKWVQCC